MLPERAIEPVEDLPSMEDLGEDLAEAGRRALGATVSLKLNGGLGTSMGLDRAKSLLPVRGDLTFLDIIARRALASGTPIVLMNSFATDQDTREVLQSYPELARGFPLTFVQHQVPKIDRQTLQPAEYPENPALEWCPPGHGDIYNSLVTRGILSRLLSAEIRYAFVSNSDNLGADLELTILGYFVKSGSPFLMEVARRTGADRKGGHLAHKAGDSGKLLLRESAQCPAEDRGAFQDVNRHRFFNTNNLWIDLGALDAKLQHGRKFLRLPMIRNAKTVNPQNAASTPVYHLETAMGAAISLFEGSEALVVPRYRFSPVKTCNDLLAARSDAMVLQQDYRLVPNPRRAFETLLVNLDQRYYRLLAEMEARFPDGPPSMLHCSSLRVSGDFVLGNRVRLLGDVELVNRTGSQVVLTDTHEIEGHRTFE
jgi:UDP-N-acetylglucosamine pyrophosphorylase